MHEWRDHTAEIELAIDAETPEQVFLEAAVALFERKGATSPAGRARALLADVS